MKCEFVISCTLATLFMIFVDLSEQYGHGGASYAGAGSFSHASSSAFSSAGSGSLSGSGGLTGGGGLSGHGSDILNEIENGVKSIKNLVGNLAGSGSGSFSGTLGGGGGVGPGFGGHSGASGSYPGSGSLSGSYPGSGSLSGSGSYSGSGGHSGTYQVGQPGIGVDGQDGGIGKQVNSSFSGGGIRIGKGGKGIGGQGGLIHISVQSEPLGGGSYSGSGLVQGPTGSYPSPSGCSGVKGGCAPGSGGQKYSSGLLEGPKGTYTIQQGCGQGGCGQTSGPGAPVIGGGLLEGPTGSYPSQSPGGVIEGPQGTYPGAAPNHQQGPSSSPTTSFGGSTNISPQTPTLDLIAPDTPQICKDGYNCQPNRNEPSNYPFQNPNQPKNTQPVPNNPICSLGGTCTSTQNNGLPNQSVQSKPGLESTTKYEHFPPYAPGEEPHNFVHTLKPVIWNLPVPFNGLSSTGCKEGTQCGGSTDVAAHTQPKPPLNHNQPTDFNIQGSSNCQNSGKCVNRQPTYQTQPSLGPNVKPVVEPQQEKPTCTGLSCFSTTFQNANNGQSTTSFSGTFISDVKKPEQKYSGPFPGPNGSIYGSKPATDSSPFNNPKPEVNNPVINHGVFQGTPAIQINKLPFPGPSGSIYDSKPAFADTPKNEEIKPEVPQGLPQSTQNNKQIFPGPTGSIFDSKPAYPSNVYDKDKYPEQHSAPESSSTLKPLQYDQGAFSKTTTYKPATSTVFVPSYSHNNNGPNVFKPEGPLVYQSSTQKPPYKASPTPVFKPSYSSAPPHQSNENMKGAIEHSQPEGPPYKPADTGVFVPSYMTVEGVNNEYTGSPYKPATVGVFQPSYNSDSSTENPKYEPASSQVFKPSFSSSKPTSSSENPIQEKPTFTYKPVSSSQGKQPNLIPTISPTIYQNNLSGCGQNQNCQTIPTSKPQTYEPLPIPTRRPYDGIPTGLPPLLAKNCQNGLVCSFPANNLGQEKKPNCVGQQCDSNPEKPSYSQNPFFQNSFTFSGQTKPQTIGSVITGAPSVSGLSPAPEGPAKPFATVVPTLPTYSSSGLQQPSYNNQNIGQPSQDKLQPSYQNNGPLSITNNGPSIIANKVPSVPFSKPSNVNVPTYASSTAAPAISFPHSSTGRIPVLIHYSGPFPGPSGSILDSKPASEVGTEVKKGSTGGSAGSYQLSPGGSYPSKPVAPIAGSYAGAGAHSAAGSISGAGTHYSGPFPGPSGSIHDSKPSSQIGTAVKPGHSSGPAPSHAPTQPAYQPGQQLPNPVQPSYQPGYAGVQPAPSYPSNPSYTPGAPSQKPVFPGPSGSIYDSKPAPGGCTSPNCGAIPVHTVVQPQPQPHPVQPAPSHSPSTGPVYNGPFPGPSGSIHDSKPAIGGCSTPNCGGPVNYPSSGLPKPDVGSSYPGIAQPGTSIVGPLPSPNGGSPYYGSNAGAGSAAGSGCSGASCGGNNPYGGSAAPHSSGGKGIKQPVPGKPADGVQLVVYGKPPVKHPEASHASPSGQPYNGPANCGPSGCAGGSGSLSGSGAISGSGSYGLGTGGGAGKSAGPSHSASHDLGVGGGVGRFVPQHDGSGSGCSSCGGSGGLGTLLGGLGFGGAKSGSFSGSGSLSGSGGSGFGGGFSGASSFASSSSFAGSSAGHY